MTHGDLVNDVALALSDLGALAWANQTGQGWAGKFVTKLPNGDIVLRGARAIRFGLPGSTDVIACLGGRMILPEIKTGTGRLQQNQKDFAIAAIKAGALHILARSVDDVRNTLRLEGLV